MKRLGSTIDYTLNHENDEEVIVKVKVIPTIIRCLGGGMKELKESIRQIFEYDNNDKELEWISREMQKTVLWESKSLIRKELFGLLT